MRQLMRANACMVAAMCISFGLGGLQISPTTSTAPHPPFKKRWTFHIEGQLSSLVVGKASAYFCTEKSVGCVDLESGRQVWARNFSDACYGAHVVLECGVLYVGIVDGKVQ